MQNGTFTRAFAGEKDDDTVIPRFYTDAEQIIVDGVAHFTDVEFVECIMPGNNLSKPVFRVTDKHRARWPNQYRAFKTNQEPPIDGVPLEEWPVLKRAQILELKSKGFRTVENIANMGDLACQNIGLGGMQLRQKAIAYLDQEKEMAITNKAIEDAAKWERLAGDLKAQVERTNEAMAQMQQQMAALQMSQHLTSQNLGATPAMQQAMEPARVAPASPFASFATNDTPRRAIRSELQELNTAGADGNGVREPVPPPREVVTIAPASPPKRRGRPSNAERAAQMEAVDG